MKRGAVCYVLSFYHQIISDCNSTEDTILVELPESLGISMTVEGGCIFLSGSASIEAYRDIISSARSVSTVQWGRRVGGTSPTPKKFPGANNI